MRPVLSAEQMKLFDRKWMDLGVPGIVLMENAGRGAAHLIGLKLRPRAAGEAARTGSAVVGSCVRCADERSLEGARVLILAGAGNNGGDGFVVARHLGARGVEVTVLVTVPEDQLKGDARAAFLAMRAMGIAARPLFDSDYSAEIERTELIVDALLGTGADRDIEGALTQVILAVNASGKYVVALDVPSGLHASRGNILGVAVRAQHTVTFAHLKAGLFSSFGHEHAGNITVSHIGVPSALPTSLDPLAWLLEEADVRLRLPPRSVAGHKGQAGRVVVVAGSTGTVGAARLVSRAALRAGAGLVTVVSAPSAIVHLEGEVVEVMTHAWSEVGPGDAEDQLFQRADALVVGPGLGRSPEAERAMERAVLAQKPCVVDADALRYFAETGRAFWQSTQPGRWSVLTPHPAEAAGLLGVSTADIEKDRVSAARALAERYGATVLLKGSRPVLCGLGQPTVLSAFGSPALGTAGSGDVFCGILAAQLVGAPSAQVVFERLMVAVALQGQAAELWSKQHGDRGLLAHEIGDLVPQIMQSWT